MSLATTSGFRFSGSLKDVNIQTLYARCQKLKLTGLMRLSQGAQSLDLLWVGGDPIEGEGDSGTRSLPIWQDGEFLVEQRIPDFRNQLTQGIELSGSLRAGMVHAIYKLCSENTLSADAELSQSSGALAQVRFTHGKADTATIDQQTESALSALSKLSGWSDGTYRITLRPLFADAEPMAAATPAKDKKRDDSKFDLTGSVGIDLSNGVEWPPKLREVDSTSGATTQPPTSAASPPKAQAPAPARPLTALPPAPNSATAATVQMTTMSRAMAKQVAGMTAQAGAAQTPAKGVSSRWLAVLVLVVLTVGGLLLFLLQHARGAAAQ